MSSSRVIDVLVVDKNGYGKSGAKVRAGNSEAITDRDGRAIVMVNSSSVFITVNGTKAYDGSTSNCPNPLLVRT